MGGGQRARNKRLTSSKKKASCNDAESERNFLQGSPFSCNEEADTDLKLIERKEKNRLSAMRSRANKDKKMTRLETENWQLSKENAILKAMLARLTGTESGEDVAVGDYYANSSNIEPEVF